MTAVPARVASAAPPTDDLRPGGPDGERPAKASAGPDPRADASSAWAVELLVATQIVQQAGHLLADRVGNHGSVAYKDPRDIVTEVDTQSEALVRAALAARFPADVFLGEESVATWQASGASAAFGRTWVCDPVDGTVNYANGIPFFCVALALVEDGRPVVGVVHDPMRGETFAATADGPATLDGLVVRASAKERLSDAVAALAISGRAPAARAGRVRRAIRISRNLGSSALSLAYVANGRFDAFCQTNGLSVWDIAAAGLIAERAGAIVTDMAGGPWFDLASTPKSTGMLAAPPAFHAQLLPLLRVGS